MAKRGALKIGESRNNVTRMGDDYYRVAIRDGKKPDGTPKRVYRYVHGTETDAAALRDQMMADRLGGKAIGTDKQPLSEYLETWLRDKAKGNRPGMKMAKVTPRTWERYASLLRGSVIPALGQVPIGDLKPEHLSDLYHRWGTEPRSVFEPKDKTPKRSHKGKDASKSKRSETPYSPTTIHHRHVALKMALDDAVKRYRLIPTNPAVDAIAPSPMPPMPERGEDADIHVLDESQLATLYDAADATNLGLLVYLAGNTGARLGELLALRVDDFDADRAIVRVERSLYETSRKSPGAAWYGFKAPKSRRSRRPIRIGPETARRLSEALAAQRRADVTRMDRLIFSSPTGEPLRPSTVSQQFGKIADGCGFNGLRFHDLRHTHASLSLKRGDPAHVVSTRLGHANVGTTLRLYSHMLPGQDEDLANGFEAMVEAKRAAK
ncbi:MAG: tyrosine-type recombinase/integrase [Coriobacteriia bacterium]|nr:tyrosine-type recombinase/integrase [Coriobacteriia bacterium]